MNAILFSPHNDDETLFAFYTLLTYKPKVVVVLRSFKEESMGGPPWQVREDETRCAMKVAGCEYEQWEYSDLDPNWWAIQGQMKLAAIGYDIVIGPAFELDGHEHHNGIAVTLRDMRWQRSFTYLTYRRGHGRSDGGFQIPATAEEIELKRQALNCYQSQIEYAPTAPWFGDDQREFVR